MRSRLLALAPILLIGTALPLQAQSADDVLTTALATWEERMEGVRDYTLTHRVMGMETVTFFEREEGSDRPVFRTRSQMRMGGQVMETSADEEAWRNQYELFPRLAELARFVGEEEVDGTRTSLLVLDDVARLDLDLAPDEAEDADFEPGEGRFWIDTEYGVLRRMRVTGTFEGDGRESEVSVTVNLRDYQEREGLFEPGRVVIVTEGLETALSPEEREEATANLEAMRRQIEQMPAEQRERMASMIDGQVEQLESVLESGSMEVVMELVDVAVNEGPPPGF